MVGHPHPPRCGELNGHCWWQGAVGEDDCVSEASPCPISDLTPLYSSYPIVFTIIVLPLSVVRFRSGFGADAQHPIPYATTFAVQFLYSLSGALNVMLFLTTRSSLLLPKSKPGISEALRHSENEEGQSRSSLVREGAPSLQYSHSTDMRLVERGDRPIALTALPGVNDEYKDW